jgi:MFS family permease
VSATQTSRRDWTAVIFVAMALGGAVLQLRGAVLPTLQRTFGTPEWQLGLVAPAGMVGYVAAVLLTGFGAGHLAPRRLIAGGLLGGGLAVVLMGLSPAFAVFALAVAVQGALNGVLRGLNRPLLSHLYPDARGRAYSLYDMAWAIGAMAGPLVLLVAAAVGDWRWAFFAVAAGWLALGAAVIRLSDPGVARAEEGITVAEIRPLLRRPPILVTGVGLVVGVGVEASLFTWLPIYATEALPPTATVRVAGATVTVGLAEATLSIMLAGYVPGRFVYGSLAERVGYDRLMTAITVAVVPAYAVTFRVLDGLAILAGIFVVGVLLSGVYPLFLAYATDALPDHSGPITAVGATTAALAFGVVPALVGALISLTDAPTALAVVLLPLAVLPGVVALARRVTP